MSNTRDTPGPVAEIVRSTLIDFFESLDREIPDLRDESDLLTDTEASSDEGVDFAIDLSDALGVEVPNDFNPFVHESGRRGRKFGELVHWAERFVSNTKESSHGT
ncbi:MAG: hypothetical protein L0Y44_11425 [Phycisphaerales bacterium]|nr:hypothetical protein [Phycisphaerales bacterium]